MFLYNFICSGDFKDYEKVEKKDNREIGSKCEDYYIKNILLNSEFFISSISQDKLEILAIFKLGIKDFKNLDELFNDFIQFMGFKIESYKRNEMPVVDFLNSLRRAEMYGFVDCVYDIEIKYNLKSRYNNIVKFSEIILNNEDWGKEKALGLCEEVNSVKTLEEEIERIYFNNNTKFGVPVHYMINSQDLEFQHIARRILTNSLLDNNRMLRKKYGLIDFDEVVNGRGFDEDDLEMAYRFNEGGAVVIKSDFDVNLNDKYSRLHDNIKKISRVIRKYASSVITILVLTSQLPGQNQLYKELLEGLLFVEISDSNLLNEDAKQYLIRLAQKNEIDILDGLTDNVEENVPYKANDLREIFDEWSIDYMKNVQFAQYKDLQKLKVEKKEEVGFAENDLRELIGLNEVKKVVKDMLNYEKVQKVLESNGLKSKATCRHMVFTGNPGTAKTTVARIIARFMKENNLLSKGDLIEVGRSDIVSKYVGGTAPKVKELFKTARGNVLFIDEAYSLYDGKDGMYGDEAINTIVQEMENNRNDMIVIFAGYKKEMQKFLDKNSGLRSRIAYEIDFPDYSEDELLEIANYQAKDMGVDISTCGQKLREIISIGKQNKNFGNGRFVRNVLEKARMKQASRLVEQDKLDVADINVLKLEDFDMPKIQENKITMGFH